MTTATSMALVVRGAVTSEQWWQLLFLPLPLLGPPSTSAVLPGALSVPVALVNPLAGLAVAVNSVLGWWREGAERRALTARTGVRLTRSEHRAWSRRKTYLKDHMTKLATTQVRLRADRLVNGVDEQGTT